MNRSGFTMVEIVIVLGVLSFVLIPLVATLVLAYQNNKTAKDTTELALIIQSCNSMLRISKPATLRTKLQSTPIRYYFADGGRYVGTTINPTNTSLIFYRCTVTANANAPQNSQMLNAFVTIEYPAPIYAQSLVYPMGVFNYGSKLP